MDPPNNEPTKNQYPNYVVVIVLRSVAILLYFTQKPSYTSTILCVYSFFSCVSLTSTVCRRSPVITGPLPRVQWRHARRPAGTWPEVPWELPHSSSTFECRWPWWDGCHWKGEPLRSKLGCLNNQTCGLNPTEDAHFSASETWLATWEDNNLDLRACSIARLDKQRVMCLDQSREKPWQLQVGLSTTQQKKKEHLSGPEECAAPTLEKLPAKLHRFLFDLHSKLSSWCHHQKMRISWTQHIYPHIPISHIPIYIYIYIYIYTQLRLPGFPISPQSRRSRRSRGLLRGPVSRSENGRRAARRPASLANPSQHESKWRLWCLI